MKKLSLLSFVVSLTIGIALVVLSAKAESATLLGYKRTPSPTGLVSIDTETAETTLIFEVLDRSIEGLAFDSINGILYGVENLSSDNMLLEIDLEAKTILEIGPVVGFTEITGMTFDETTDKIYALDQTLKTLLEINPSTGEGTSIAYVGLGASNALATQPGTGQLFASANVTPGNLYRLDKVTGARTLVGPFGTGDLIVSGLSFHPDTGVLFGKAGGPSGGPLADGRLVTIDLTTGLATPIGEAIGGINALAFVEETVSYSCVGFEPPFDDKIILKKKNKRAIPVMKLFDFDGNPITDQDVSAPPLVDVNYEQGTTPGPGYDVDLVPPGLSDDGNEFRYDPVEGLWIINLSTKQFTASGNYSVTAVAPVDSGYSIDPTCTETFERLH